jgi:hypothetical protein
MFSGKEMYHSEASSKITLLDYEDYSFPDDESRTDLNSTDEEEGLESDLTVPAQHQQEQQEEEEENNFIGVSTAYLKLASYVRIRRETDDATSAPTDEGVADLLADYKHKHSKESVDVLSVLSEEGSDPVGRQQYLTTMTMARGMNDGIDAPTRFEKPEVMDPEPGQIGLDPPLYIRSPVNLSTAEPPEEV